MSLDLEPASDQPLSSLDELVDYFRRGEKSPQELRLGLEHEKLVYPAEGTDPVPYEGASGIGALLLALTSAGWEPYRDSPGGPAIALRRGEEAVSLEPGGQLELSGAPVRTAREAHRQNLVHLEEAQAAASRLGLRLVTLGYRPFDSVDDMPWMPKSRYRAMRKVLPERGPLARDMMLLTATGQVSLDWVDEEDCGRKVQLVARLTPALVAMFANSPLVRGKPSGLLSYRSHVWDEVDPCRCGYIRPMLEGEFTYRAYTEWALDAPLLFLRRRGGYVTPKLTFRQLLAQGFEGKPPSHTDWLDHLSTLFPEVRIKRVLEVRGADCVGPALTGALAALCRGLLYDPQALAEAEALAPKLGFEAHLELHRTAQREGLGGSSGEVALAPLCRELVEIAERGLSRLDPEDASLLEPLREVVASGASPAERVLQTWERTRDPKAVLAASTL